MVETSKQPSKYMYMEVILNFIFSIAKNITQNDRIHHVNSEYYLKVSIFSKNKHLSKTGLINWYMV